MTINGQISITFHYNVHHTSGLIASPPIKVENGGNEHVMYTCEHFYIYLYIYICTSKYICTVYYRLQDTYIFTQYIKQCNLITVIKNYTRGINWKDIGYRISSS